MNFERGKNPKRSLRIGKKSNKIFSRIEENAISYGCTPCKMEESWQKYIDSYARVPPSSMEIIIIWRTISKRKKTNEIFIFYDEILEEEDQWGLGLPVGTVVPWIFNISYKEGQMESERAVCRTRAEEYMDELKWQNFYVQF